MEFNSRPIGEHSGNVPEAINSARNLHEITENLEEYYRQKAPNLWNAWIRTNNMLVELNERYDKLVTKVNYVYKTVGAINEQLDYLIKLQERKPYTPNPNIPINSR